MKQPCLCYDDLTATKNINTLEGESARARIAAAAAGTWTQTQYTVDLLSGVILLLWRASWVHHQSELDG
jgi:hypothetical protein